MYKRLIKDKVGCEMKTLCASELNCLAIQLKLELYTSEGNWKNSDHDMNRNLFTFIHIIEQRLTESILRQWNLDM